MEDVSKERSKSVTRRELFLILRKNGNIQPTRVKSRQLLTVYVQSKLGLEDATDGLKRLISNFTASLSEKWSSCHRDIKIFNKKYEKWLNEKVTLADGKSSTPSKNKKPGRPSKGFDESCVRSRRKKVSNLIQTASTRELTLATQIKQRSAASVLKEATSSPTRASKMKKALQKPHIKTEFTPEEALALIIDLKLTKHAYIELRKRALEKQSTIFPSYNSVQIAKNSCYPAKEAIKVTDVGAEIKLQDLVDITAERLLIVQEQVIDQYASEIDLNKVEMIYKWGMDGSSGQNQYKQQFNIEGFREICDANLFVCSMVPIQLNCFRRDNSGEKVILWQNPRLSSTRYCRPIRFQCAKETVELTKCEIKNIQEQINNIQPTVKQIGDMQVQVNRVFHMTMIDGKVCNSLSETSSQVCYICRASPKNMNDLENIKKTTSNTATYSFGLSTLHAWIRLFECLLHISYRLDLKKWQVRSVEEKKLLLNRKQCIISRFRKETGLIVDQPKQGFGSTNDGNTARRFFENPKKSAEITGVDERLIRRFSTILHVLSSGYEINIEKFETYTYDTAKLYVELYGWFYMPASVHKILLHGAEVIKHFLLPIGQLSEDAQEARNKDFRRYRENHTRKSSRCNTNEDLLKRLLISSDPLISNIRPLPKKKSYIILEEVRSLLECPEIIPRDPVSTRSTAERVENSESSSNTSYSDSESEIEC